MGKIFSVEFLIQSIPQIAVYLPITLLITIASLCSRTDRMGSLLRWPVILKYGYLRQLRKYTYQFIRGTPTMVQLVLVYYGIPIFASCDERSMGNKF
mgnify:CR=1 FL=1